VALALLGGEKTARAEVSSWLSIDGGYAFQRNAVRDYDDRAAAMSFAVGAGSTPDASFVVGAIFRSTTYFNLGTDLSIGPRIASGGFARGDWGLALDVGVTGRYWRGGDYGRYPVNAMVYGGTPWGFELGLGTELFSLSGQPNARGFQALVGIDLLRLTVMRRGSTEKTWPNPAPATAPDPASLHTPDVE
jgi:hypothetical protein